MKRRKGEKEFSFERRKRGNLMNGNSNDDQNEEKKHNSFTDVTKDKVEKATCQQKNEHWLSHHIF